MTEEGEANRHGRAWCDRGEYSKLAVETTSTGADGERKARNERKAQMPDNKIVGNGGYDYDNRDN